MSAIIEKMACPHEGSNHGSVSREAVRSPGLELLLGMAARRWAVRGWSLGSAGLELLLGILSCCIIVPGEKLDGESEPRPFATSPAPPSPPSSGVITGGGRAAKARSASIKSISES